MAMRLPSLLTTGLYLEMKVSLTAVTVCIAHGIHSFHAPGHLGFPCLESENPAWTLRLFGDWLADRVPPRLQFVGRAVPGLRHFSRPAPRICAFFCVPCE